MTRRPPPADLRLAAEWLECNEGEEEELAACHQTAKWLRTVADQAERDAEVRRLARETGHAAGTIKKVLHFLRDK